jgi:hypothetical protein
MRAARNSSINLFYPTLYAGEGEAALKIGDKRQNDALTAAWMPAALDVTVAERVA